MIGVFSDVPGYDVAVAELPLSTGPTSRTEGAIVVVQGNRRWVQAARAALVADAAAVVVSDPEAFADDDCVELERVAAGRPIIVDRPLLRADVVASAVAQGVMAHYVSVDVAAAAGRRASVTREAIGWMRVLAGGTCEVQGFEKASSVCLALVQRVDAAIAGALTASTITGADEGAWIRAVAVADSRVEVLVDEADARATVEVVGVDGVLRLPRRFESHERQSLRRAMQAVASSSVVTDLADLRADAVIAHQLADKQH